MLLELEQPTIKNRNKKKIGANQPWEGYYTNRKLISNSLLVFVNWHLLVSYFGKHFKNAQLLDYEKYIK